jgi:lambda family phage portal protein
VFDERDPATLRAGQKVVAARDALGRPAVVHLQNNVGAYRGMSPLAPVLEVFKQWDQLQAATLAAAMIQAIFAATIESTPPTGDVLKALLGNEEQAGLANELGGGPPPGSFAEFMGAKTDWYRNTKIDFGEIGKIVHLFAGETLKFNRSEHPNTTYEAFSKSLHRQIARCIGIIYPQFTGDYVGETYTSIRMAIADIWIINLFRRAYFPARLKQQLFMAWLEGDIELGNTPFPGGVAAFRAQKTLVCRCDWRGPARPTADDLKTAKAQQIQRQEGWVPTEQLAAEYGNDHRDVIASQARTEKMRSESDPPLPPLGVAAALGGGSFGDGGEPNAPPGGDGGSGGGGGDNPAAQRARDDRLVRALIEDDDKTVDSVLQDERNHLRLTLNVDGNKSKGERVIVTRHDERGRIQEYERRPLE